MLRQAVPSSHAVGEREPSSRTRPATTIWRCTEIIVLM